MSLGLCMKRNRWKGERGISFLKAILDKHIIAHIDKMRRVLQSDIIMEVEKDTRNVICLLICCKLSRSGCLQVNFLWLWYLYLCFTFHVQNRMWYTCQTHILPTLDRLMVYTGTCTCSCETPVCKPAFYMWYIGISYKHLHKTFETRGKTSDLMVHLKSMCRKHANHQWTRYFSSYWTGVLQVWNIS